MNADSQLLLGLACRLGFGLKLEDIIERHFSPSRQSKRLFPEENDCRKDSNFSEELFCLLEDAFVDAGLRQIPGASVVFILVSERLQAKYGRRLLDDLKEACSYQLSFIEQTNCEEALRESVQWLKRSECEFAALLACDEKEAEICGAAILLANESTAAMHGLSSYAELELVTDVLVDALPALEKANLHSATLIEPATKDRLQEGEADWIQLEAQLKTAAGSSGEKEARYISSLSLELCQGSEFLAPFLSLINSALSLHLRVLPGINTPKPFFSAKGTLAPLLQARPWIHPASPLEMSKPRRALLLMERKICLLKEYGNDIELPELKKLKNQTSEIFLFASESPDLLIEQVQILHAELCNDDSRPIQNLAFKNNCQSHCRGRYRLAIICRDREELIQLLEASLLQLSSFPDEASSTNSNRTAGFYYSGNRQAPTGKLVFVLPGLGAAYPNMLEELCFFFPEVRQVFDFVELLAMRAGDRIIPSRAIYPVSGMQESSQAMLATMDSAVITLLLAEWAIFALLKKLGVRADVFLGCSTGEFAAITMSEAIDILSAAETFYKLSTHVSRSISLEQLSKLKSIRISGSYEKSIRHLLEAEAKEKIFLGADLSPGCVLVSGDREAIEKFCAKLKQEKIDFINLPVAIPYHTELVSGIINAEDEDIRKLEMGAPKIESWSCSTESRYPNDEAGLRAISTELFEKPIRLRSTIEKLYETGARIFVELGPKGGLTPFISETLAGREHLSIAADLPTRPGMDQLHTMLAQLFCRGVDLQAQALYERRVTQEKHMELKPESLLYELLQSGYDPMLAGVNPLADEVMLTYLSTMQEFQTSLMNTQEKLMLAYLQASGTELEEDFEPAVQTGDLPFFSGVEVGYGPESYTVNLLLNTRTYPFLLDHAIGGATSAIDERSKVYLLPLMVTLEVLAEAASLICQASVISRISDVRAYKRIRCSDEDLHLVVELRKLDEHKIDTRICLQDVDDDDTGLLASAIIEFADAYPAAPEAAVFPQIEGRESKLYPGNLYGAGSMFHGPLMQSVTEISKVFSRSIEGKLECRPSLSWFAGFDNQSRLLIDPLLLDNASQFVLYQMYEHDLPATALLPFHIAGIEFFQGYDLLEGELHAAAHLRSMSLRGTEAQLELRDSEGIVRARINEISSRAIVLPEVFRCFIESPDRYICPKLAIKSVEDSAVAVIEKSVLPEDDTALDWITDYFLSPDEQAQWRRIGRAESRRRDWLAGRMAAKDAVRYLLKEKCFLDLRPADIEIRSLNSGAVEASIKSREIDWMPQISISHCQSMAAAIAERPAGNRRAGIDVENIVKREEGFETLAFSKQEIDSLKAMKNLDLSEGMARLWTAKEAAAKAAGSGFNGDPKSFSMKSKDPESNEILIGTDKPDGKSGLYHCSIHSNPKERYCIAVVRDFSPDSGS